MSDSWSGPTPATLASNPAPASDVVAATRASLEQLEGLEVAEHPALFEAIHADLRVVLNSSAHR